MNAAKTSLILAAFALALAAPAAANAKGGNSNGTTEKHGKIDSTKNGHGHITRTVTKDSNGDKVIDTTKTFKNGNTYDTVETIVHNADGTISKDFDKTLPSGQTVTVDQTITKASDGTKTVDSVTTKANGNVVTTDLTYTQGVGQEDVSGTKTLANGKVLDVSGFKTQTDYGTDKYLTFTKQNGKTETVDKQTLTVGDSVTHVTTKTNFKGDTTTNANTVNWAHKCGCDADLIDTTAHGQGTVDQTVTNTGPGTKTIDTTKSFDDGYSASTVTDVTKSTTGVTKDSTTTNSNGQTVTNDRTIVANTSGGGKTITGTETLANGQTVTYTAQRVKTAYGYDTEYVYTNATGETKTVDDQTYKNGDATTNVKTGTNYNGKTIESTSTQY